MTDKQFERIKKGLDFHSEGGVYNLCTLTETTLRAILDDATKELEAQIEKMKCCGNCRWEEPSSFCDNCKRLEGQIFADTLTSDNWEINFGVSN